MTDTLKAGGAALWPVKMDTGIGGHFGSSFNVEYESEGVLVYKHWEEGTVIADDQVVPTDQQWTAFWRIMETLEVWDWLPRYENHDIVDGTSWGVRVEYAGKSIDSGGSNSFPRAPEETKNSYSTELFHSFTEAVSALLGGRSFS